ncbi:hypothetical protein FT663_05021 [Candidozyma haemuli var. vulneris]|uniref:Adenylyl cyclase-associated protein n=1 Tax=Candidozyma haemuli TaxID=45357 RepID=A0A2V1AWN2_9ASCO|nr:hypothetical protein CXQ85_000733 [[Candida] haemuloni]KAF3985528.1 hypothetical protein FT662_05099 [[Candida] haemuloni var. vulneris]KAF3986088.1 hypothetical protein FT663_05021 [[Candida] haemuloni var. vulneris]PVH21743.1 hypothetical protein CXQ85_000733 [[Candida] haemuloni]
MPPQGPAEENQLNVQGYNIVTILKRLEAATCRLEDITIFQEEANKAQPLTRDSVSEALSAPSSSDVSEVSKSAVTSTEPHPVKTPADAAPAKFVTAFDEFIKSHIVPFVTLSKAIDQAVGAAAAELCAAFVEEGKFLGLVAQTKKPGMDDASLQKALEPINLHIFNISLLKDSKRGTKTFNHLNTISEGAPVLGWIVSGTPLSFVPEYKDSARFWSDRIMKEYRDKNETQVEWVKAFLSIFDDLRLYVKEHHFSGVAWNPQGSSLEESLAAAVAGATNKSSPASSGSAPPPPPPPAPPANIYEDSSSKPKDTSSSGGMKAVFSDLNKGENVTSGLKKVEKSQMTHKNPALRQEGVTKKPAPPKKPTNLSSSSSGTIKKNKPPRVELVDGAKWIIENLNSENTKEPVVIDAEMQHSVFIGNTDGVTVQINGKGNAVSLSETRNTGVVVHSLISGVDVIKSVKFGLQVTGLVPLITIDKSDEGNIYLSKDSVENDSSVVTSNTTALNINVPTEEDYEELAVPEQLQHFVRNGKLVSEVVEHAG